MNVVQLIIQRVKSLLHFLNPIMALGDQIELEYLCLDGGRLKNISDHWRCFNCRRLQVNLDLLVLMARLLLLPAFLLVTRNVTLVDGRNLDSYRLRRLLTIPVRLRLIRRLRTGVEEARTNVPRRRMIFVVNKVVEFDFFHAGRGVC